jgi:hypothetical protein
MGIPAFRIFNGHSRGLGQNATMAIYMQMSVGFRGYLHYFKGAQLAAFIAIALHANDEGWSEPSLELLSEETGYGIDTLSLSISKLCEKEIEGHRVLLVNQPRDAAGHVLNNRYLIFPTPEEINYWQSQSKYARAPRQPIAQELPAPVVPNDNHPSDEDIGIFTNQKMEYIKVQTEARDGRATEGKPLVAEKPKRPRSTKKITDPLHHVVKAWWQSPIPGPNRVVVNHGKDGKQIELIVATIRGLSWPEERVEAYLQECFEYFTSTGPKREVEFYGPSYSLGTMPDRLQAWYNNAKLASERQRSATATTAMKPNVPFVPTRRVS